MLGTLLGMAGRSEEAEDAFRRALYLDPKDALALHRMGALLAGRGDSAGAARYLRRAGRPPRGCHVIARNTLMPPIRGNDELLNRPIQDWVRREWADQLAEPEAVDPGPTRGFLRFAIGTDAWAIDLEHLLEVAESRPARRIPGRSAGALEGMVNIRGELGLCLSGRAVFGVSRGDAPTGGERLLRLADGGAEWLLRVDAVSGVVRVPVAQVLAPPVGQIGLAMGVVYYRSGATYAVVDAAKLFEKLKEGLR